MPEETKVSTYCLVATCKADTGSCVTVTEVRPTGASAVAPKAMLVVPNVIWLLVNDAFAMLDNVLFAALMVLLVIVWDAVFVVTVSPPTVAAAMLNVPSVTVLPVKVRADGSDKTILAVPVAVISFGVPATDSIPATTVMLVAAVI